MVIDQPSLDENINNLCEVYKIIESPLLSGCLLNRLLHANTLAVEARLYNIMNLNTICIFSSGFYFKYYALVVS